MDQIRISSVMCTAKLVSNEGHCRLDLLHIARNLWNVEYRPEKFNALTYRTRRPARCTVNLFGSGKIVITGVPSVEMGKKAAAHFAHQLGAKTNYSCRVEGFSVSNIVCTSRYHTVADAKIPLHKIYDSVTDTYEPELFPALHFSLAHAFPSFANPKACIFPNGKIIVIGLNNMKYVKRAFKIVFNRIKRQIGTF